MTLNTSSFIGGFVDTSFTTQDKAHALKSAMQTRNLQDLYPELARGNPKEKFSMARMFNDMALREFQSGSSYEADLCTAAARAQGGEHDPQRAIVPWSVLCQRGLTTSTPTAGGNLVGTAATGPIDVLRPYSVVARLGVQKLENNIQNLSLPNLGASVTGQWLSSESSNIAPADMVTGVVSSQPKTAGAMMRASRQFLLQAQNSEFVIRQQLLAAMGTCLDQAVLQGTGLLGQPTGIINTAGIGTNSGAFSWDSALEMLETLANANADDEIVKFISTPTVRRLLQKREIVSTSGRMVWDANQIAGKSAAVTTDCPAGTIIAGDWSQCLIAFWGGGIEIQVDPYTSFKTGAVQVRALMFADVNIPKPGTFFKHESVS